MLMKLIFSSVNSNALTLGVSADLDSKQHRNPIVFMDIIRRHVIFKTRNVSETAFCICLQVEPTQLDPIDRASPYLRT
jgi:hypothetical protein